MSRQRRTTEQTPAGAMWSYVQGSQPQVSGSVFMHGGRLVSRKRYGRDSRMDNDTFTFAYVYPWWLSGKTDGPCDPRHREKTRGRYVNGVKLTPLWPGGPRWAILAAALWAHQISRRYLSDCWRAHIIYFQWFFVSQLVFEHTFELWLSMIDEKSLGNRDPSRCVNRKQITKVSKTSNDQALKKSCCYKYFE